MVDQEDLEVSRRSVARGDPFTSGVPGLAYPFNILSSFAGGIPDWGTDVNARDAMMAQFLTTENIAASAVATVASRNAAYTWEITADSDSLRETVTDLLNSADLGRGWEHFAMALGVDYLTQDKGAFVELIRSGDSPTAPLIGLRHLSARDCWSTGKIEEPVVFRDKNGKVHRLKWYQVYRLAEQPMQHPIYEGLQFSALSRFIRLAQVNQNITQYIDEKTGGRHSRAIFFVNGVGAKELNSAMSKVQMEADNAGLLRYAPPVVIPTLSDKQPAEVAKIELASLPDGFDQEANMRQYLMALSLALLVDFQELAPLPSGNIGTGSQSDTLDQKSRQKGAALWRKKLAGMMSAILPPQASFTYTEQDVDEEAVVAENKATRADARSTQVATGELDAEGARSLAVLQGDIPIEIADEVAARGEAATQEPEDPFGDFEDTGSDDTVSDENVPEGNEETEKAVPVRPERMELEDEAEARVDETLRKVFRRIRRDLRTQETV
jgi:hypothetical protein